MTETQLNAAFYVHRDTGINYDAACSLVRDAASHADSDGILYDAHMLAEVVIELAQECAARWNALRPCLKQH